MEKKYAGFSLKTSRAQEHEIESLSFTLHREPASALTAQGVGSYPARIAKRVKLWGTKLPNT